MQSLDRRRHYPVRHDARVSTETPARPERRKPTKQRRRRRLTLWQILGTVAVTLAVLAVAVAVVVDVTRPAPPADPIAEVIVPNFGDRPELTRTAQSDARLIRSAFSDTARDTTVVVLGDSTGDEPDEWVYRIGAWASVRYARPVTLMPWNDGARAYGTPVQLGTGPGRPLTIWNASAPGRDAGYTRVTLPAMLPPEATTIDALFVSHGHNQSRGLANVRGALASLNGAIAARDSGIPIAVIAQNPNKFPDQTDQAGKVDAARSFADQFDRPTIDVFDAFVRTGDSDALMADSEYPNTAGSELWAATVEQWIEQP